MKFLLFGDANFNIVFLPAQLFVISTTEKRQKMVRGFVFVLISLFSFFCFRQIERPSECCRL
jgi:hypothetical protein